MYHQDWCFLAVQGPESVHVMRRLFPEAGDLGFMRCVESEFRRRPVIVTRSGYTGEVGFELFTYQDVARELWAAAARRRWRRSGGCRAGSPRATCSAWRWATRSTARTCSSPSTALEAGSRMGGRASTRASSAGERRCSASKTEGLPSRLRGLRMHERRHIPRAHYPVFVGDQLVGEVTERDVLTRARHGDRARLPVAGRRGDVGRRGRGGHPRTAGHGRPSCSRRSSIGAPGRVADGRRSGCRLGRAADGHEVADRVVAEARAGAIRSGGGSAPARVPHHRHHHVQARRRDPHRVARDRTPAPPRSTPIACAGAAHVCTCPAPRHEVAAARPADAEGRAVVEETRLGLGAAFGSTWVSRDSTGPFAAR